MNVCLCTIPSMGGSCEGCPNNKAISINPSLGDYKHAEDWVSMDVIEEFRRLIRKMRAEGRL